MKEVECSLLAPTLNYQTGKQIKVSPLTASSNYVSNATYLTRFAGVC